MSSLHIRLLQLMHKWVLVPSTHCLLIGVCVSAWERRCCQPAFVCISAHVSLFKHHMLVIWFRRSYGAEQNLVTLLVHCHIYRAISHPQPYRPHLVTPLCCFCHLPLSAGTDVTAVKECLLCWNQQACLNAESLYCRSAFNVTRHIQDVVWATCCMVVGVGVSEVATVFQQIMKIFLQIFVFLCAPSLLHIEA